MRPVRIIDGVEYEVIWSGEEGLVADRETKDIHFWSPPKRIYNKKSAYWDKAKEEDDAVLCDSGEVAELEPDSGSTE